ncbi:aldo/keto reductase [Gemmatimonas sp.]|uniref:aldo/keto reductase n=1 Tax=Gemmatimonas sp. TaxID=1962908 RepID=UPI0035690F5D
MSAAPDIEYRPLGSTGLDVSVLGFGSWAAGGDKYVFGLGMQSDADTVEAICTAVSHGVNWIDTAAVYGFGHSELIIGRAISSIPPRDRPLIITKCGLVAVSDDSTAMPERSLRPDSIRDECLASLDRLGVDHIDVYLFHWPDMAGTALSDSWEAMQSLVSEGLVRFAGLSNFSVEQMDECERIATVSVVSPPLSLIRRSSLRDIIPWCAERKRAVITYSPLQSGLLTGYLTRERAALMLQDWRRESPEVHEPLLSALLDAQPALVEVAARYGVFPGVAAIGWVMAQPGVSGVIVGARTGQHAEQWLSAGRITLTQTDLTLLEAATAAFADFDPVDPVKAHRSND